MTIMQLLERMIVFSNGNFHDIDHFTRVWAYARLIGEEEGLSVQTQFLLEAAAITHDIACPLCREKYGNTNGKLQESEGAVLVTEFLRETDLTAEETERIAFLVAHHHTLSGIDSPDWQILVEADYLANAMECGYSLDAVKAFCRKIFKTTAGSRLARELFCF